MKHKDRNITSADFQRYLDNKMSPKERNSFEKKLQNNPFEDEALEGLKSIPTDELKSDLNELKQKITRQSLKPRYWIWGAAASIAILVSAGVILFRQIRLENTTQVAISEKKSKEESKNEKTISVEEINKVKKNESISKQKIETESITSANSEEQHKNDLKDITKGETGKSIAPVKQGNENIKAVSSKSDQSKSAYIPSKAIYDSSNVRFTEESIQEKPSEHEELIAVDEMAVSKNSLTREQPATNYYVDGIKVQEIETRGDKSINNTRAQPVKGYDYYYSYIEDNAILPDQYNKKRVVVKLSVDIDKYGKIFNIRNLNNSDSVLFNKSKEIIINGPEWQPAIVDGVKVNSSTDLKIIFRKTP